MKPETYFFIAKLFKIAIIVFGVLAVGVFLVPVYLGVKERRIRKRKLREFYESREPLDDDRFYEQFYESRNVPKDIVQKVRKILTEDFYSLDVSRILPQDDFTDNLSIIWGQWSGLDGLEAVEVVERFEKEFNITISDPEAAAMKTIEDMILTIWWKILHDDKTSRVAQ